MKFTNSILLKVATVFLTASTIQGKSIKNLEDDKSLNKTNENCGALFSQCGGIGYTGSTCCNEGVCVAVNDYYHHCAKLPQMSNEEMMEKIKEVGLSELSVKYTLMERPVQEKFANLNVYGMKFNLNQYEVLGVGNLFIMDTSSPAYSMLTYVLTPFYKDIPMFSTDFVFQGDNRQVINEFYSLVSNTTKSVDPNEDTVYNDFMRKLKGNMDSCQLEDTEEADSWLNEYRPAYVNKKATKENDQEIIGLFLSNLKLLVNFEQASPYISKEDKSSKYENTKEYVDKLISQGGISTNMFKAVLGEETTREFFYTIFFGTECFKPYYTL